MSPEITVHRPRGVLPKVVVQKRTVVDYQPSWLLIAIPALAVVRLTRRKMQPRTDQLSAELADSPDPFSARWRRPRLRRRSAPEAFSDGEAETL